MFYSSDVFWHFFKNRRLAFSCVLACVATHCALSNRNCLHFVQKTCLENNKNKILRRGTEINEMRKTGVGLLLAPPVIL